MQRSTGAKHRTGLLTVLAAAAILLAAEGCRPLAERSKVGFYLDAPALASGVRQAALVPLKNETNYLPLADTMTSALLEAVQARQLFHVEVVRVLDPATEGAVLDGRRELTLKELAHLRQTLRCDAVLLGTVNQFQPYPRMRIGLYLRLLDLRDSRVLWAVDHTWDATDQETQERIARYFYKERGGNYEPLGWQLATFSPAALAQFVAHEAAATLPPKTQPENLPAGRQGGGPGGGPGEL
ncbi:MAG: hypothetical protein FJ288_12300 [Planctomycetes bacterium]|nr:hypothetical protein [Planctomycetota bacterium]